MQGAEGERPTKAEMERWRRDMQRYVARMQYVMGGAYVLGLVMFMGLVVFLHTTSSAPPPGQTGPVQIVPITPPTTGLLGIDPKWELLFMLSGGTALVLVPLSFVVRTLITPRAPDVADSGKPGRLQGFYFGIAMCEGAGLFGGVVMLLSHQITPPIYVASLGLLGVLAHVAIPACRVERDPGTTRYSVGS